MKKIILFVLTTLLLTACVNNDVKLEAKVTDFEDSGFRNNNNQLIILVEDGILVSSGTVHLLYEEPKKSDIDEVLEKENAESGPSFLKIYNQGKIETKGSKYYVTLDDNISLEFEKTGERIIKDSNGVEYYTEEYSK
ncbi:hypothetical protein M3649_19755 [Ureibacillus chungkukjangi]|uniref:hypothetical protein n=1 Tax=Ureibacillus chungkukjangi TaxID=1202712 RepID=UPI00203CB57E|nr:hypothetical protein [Ureibacillus chungkukjangi]MCM3390332.1 hypothetical protein [Ureibacillus chungkukjangi]